MANEPFQDDGLSSSGSFNIEIGSPLFGKVGLFSDDQKEI